MHLEFAAVLGVKDEREVLPHCIAHLRGIGVGRIMAIDCGSTDGSLEWLQDNASDLLHLTRFSDVDPDAAAWERLNMQLARDANADWVLFMDADEFWIPASGLLRLCHGLADLDLLRVDRFNVAMDSTGPLAGPDGLPSDPRQLALIVEPVPGFRSRLESEPDLPWIRGVPLPKIMARPDAINGLADGGHDMSARPGVELRRSKPADLLVAHLPFSSLHRFQRKLDNIRRVFDVHDAYFGEHMAWHWRRWLSLDDSEAVRREFERQCFDEATLREFRESGVVQQATEWFQRQRGRVEAA